MGFRLIPFPKNNSKINQLYENKKSLESNIIHLNLDPLHFQKSYQLFDMTHIFPLDQIHSYTHLFHHI